MINGPFPMVGATLPGPNHRHVTAAPFRWSAGLLGTNAAGASWDLRCQTWGVLECVLSCFVWLILPKDNFVEKIQLGHKLSDLISRWFNHTLNMSMGICIYVYWDVSITITNQRCDSLGCLKIGDSSNHRFHAMIKTMGFWRLNHPMLGDDMTHFDPYSHPGFHGLPLWTHGFLRTSSIWEGLTFPGGTTFEVGSDYISHISHWQNDNILYVSWIITMGMQLLLMSISYSIS